MITEKDIQTRIAEILSENGFHVVASEAAEGFKKPAVFISVFPSRAALLPCGGASEEITDSVQLTYISSLETAEDCVNAANKIKKIFLYHPFEIQDRRLTIQEIEFDIDKPSLFVYFDITFIQSVDRIEDYDEMEDLQFDCNIFAVKKGLILWDYPKY